MPVFTLDTEPLRRAFSQGLDLRPLMHRLGVFVVSKVVQRFRTQRIGNEAMPPRGSSDENYANIPAIIRYLQKGQGSPDIPDRYFQRRPALIDTGRLMHSITYQVDSDSSFKVGTNVNYAAKQFLGGSETMPGAGRGGDKTVRSGLAKYLKRNKDKRKALGHLFSKDEVEASPKPRNVLEVTPDLESDLLGIIDEWVGKNLSRD